jgi:peptide/nickel transport system substrate-binding protein
MRTRGIGWRTLTLVSLFCSALVAAGACSRKAPESRAPVTAHPGTGSPQRGGRLVLGMQQEPEILNSVLQVTKSSRLLAAALFSRFVTWDDSLHLIPDLLTEVPTGKNGGISPDNLTYTYHLRHDARWHDGQPLTSADVRFTFDVIMDSLCGAESQQGFELVDRVDTPDSFTVIFHLREPYASFVADTFSDEDVLPQHLLAGSFGRQFRSAPYNRAPVGSGPFVFKEWVPGDHITVTRFDGYYGGAPYLDEIVFKVVPDANALALQLQAGDLQGYDQAEASQVPLLATLPGVQLYRTPALEYEQLAFNCGDPILADVRVRRALAAATDRDALAQHVYEGMAEPARADMHPRTPWYNAAADTANRFDPVRARTALEAAGWRDTNGDGVREKKGRPLRLTIVTTAGRPARERAEQVLQQQWRAVGVDLVIHNVGGEILFGSAEKEGMLRTARFQVALFGWGQPPDPAAMEVVYGSKFFPPQGQNFGRYRDAALDSLTALGTRITAQELRVPVYHQIEAILLRDMPVIPLVWHVEVDPMTTRLHNYRPNPIATAGDTWNVRDWWLAPPPS